MVKNYAKIIFFFYFLNLIQCIEVPIYKVVIFPCNKIWLVNLILDSSISVLSLRNLHNTFGFTQTIRIQIDQFAKSAMSSFSHRFHAGQVSISPTFHKQQFSYEISAPKITKKRARKTLMKLTAGVNFTNILHAAFFIQKFFAHPFST